MEPLKNALQGFVNKFFEKKYFIRHFRENQQKMFFMFSRFWPIRGWVGGRAESVKKNMIWDEFFFQIILNEILESYKNHNC